MKVVKALTILAGVLLVASLLAYGWQMTGQGDAPQILWAARTERGRLELWEMIGRHGTFWAAWAVAACVASAGTFWWFRHLTRRFR
jgi:hypothetical protein